MKPMTVAQVAKALHRHPELIREWIRDGRLRAQKFGPTWMVDEREVKRFARSAPERRRRPKS
jgi:excisionase family DNA binding protein